MTEFLKKWKNWEQWPFWLRYFNITPVWLWYCLRARSFWFFTPSNPTLTFGGFEGESKQEMYEQLPPASFPKTVYILPGIPSTELLSIIHESGFQYPFIAKPDVGMSGILFRKIISEGQLLQYHALMPVNYIVQELVHFPEEYSVFYYRYPYEQKGVITGFLKKEPMNVSGNGRDNLKTLIENHPQARYRLQELISWHNQKLNYVLPEGEKYFLTHAANLNRGASFINLHREIDNELHAVFDKLNHHSKAFYYGRYDLKAKSPEDLKQGKNFLILEYNGSGAEPNHVYHSGYTLRRAHNEILKHWKILFKISMYNHKHGIAFWPFQLGWQYLKKAEKHFDLLKELDTRT